MDGEYNDKYIFLLNMFLGDTKYFRWAVRTRLLNIGLVKGLEKDLIFS